MGVPAALPRVRISLTDKLAELEELQLTPHDSRTLHCLYENSAAFETRFVTAHAVVCHQNRFLSAPAPQHPLRRATVLPFFTYRSSRIQPQPSTLQRRCQSLQLSGPLPSATSAGRNTKSPLSSGVSFLEAWVPSYSLRADRSEYGLVMRFLAGSRAAILVSAVFL